MKVDKSRIGIFTPSTGIEDAAECLKFVKARGGLIQAWTLSKELAHEIKPGMNKESVLMGIADGNITVSSLSGYMDWTEKENNPARIDELKRLISETSEMATNIICTETGRQFTDRNDSSAWDMLVGSMKELAEEAEKQNVSIAIEMGRRDLIFGTGNFRKLQELVGSSALKINFDPANLLMGEINPVEAAKELKDDIVQVHLKDACSIPKMMPLTKGEVDFPAIIAILEGNGYTGNYIIEQEYARENKSEAVASDYENIVNLIT